MAYITTADGIVTTPRALFLRMPPKTHNKDNDKSEVILHIASVLGSDLERAKRTFDSIRCKDSRIIVFDAINRVWHGAEWVSSDEDTNRIDNARRFTRLHRLIDELQEEVTDLKRRIGLLEAKSRRMAKRSKVRKDEYMEEEPEPQPEPQPKPDQKTIDQKNAEFEAWRQSVSEAFHRDDACTEAGSTRPN